jgi:hypothetical protein
MSLLLSLLVAAIVAALVIGGGALAWRAGGPQDRPLDPATPARLVVLVYVVMYGVGAVVLAATGEATVGPFVTGGAFIAIGAGAWLGRRLLGPVSGSVAGVEVGPIRPIVIVLLAGLGLVAFGSLAMQFGLPLISADPQAARTGYGGFRLDMFRWLVPPAALVALGVALARPSRMAWAVAATSLALVAGLEVLAASRALPFELGIAAVLIVLWAGRRPTARHWLLLGLAAAVLFLGVQFARIGNEGGFSGALDAAGFGVRRTVDRVLLVHPRTIDLVVRTFPGEQPFMAGGTYVRWLSPLTGSEPAPALGTTLFQALFPGEPGGGFAAPGLLGEAWANGGPLLAAVLMIALGFAAVGLSRVADGLSAGAVDRTLAAVLAVALARTYAASLNGFLLTAAVTVAWWLCAGGRLSAIARLQLLPGARPTAGRGS